MKKTIILFILMLCFSTTLFARGSSSAILIDPYFSFGMLSVGGSNDLNDKIADIRNGNTAKGVSGIDTASGVSFAKSFGAFMGYRFKHRYSLGLIIDRTSASTMFNQESATAFKVFHGSTTPVTAKYYEFSGGMDATTLGAAFYYTIYSGGKLTIDTGLGILYGLKVGYNEDSTYSAIAASDTAGLDNNLNSVSGTGKAFGFMLNVSSTYYLMNYLGIGFDLGYKYMKASSLTDANGNELNFTWPDGTTDPTPVPLSANLSGLYFGLVLKIEFDLGTATGSEPIAEEAYSPEASKPSAEMGAGWEDTPVAAPVSEAGPSIDDLRDLKKQVQRQWNTTRNESSAVSQKKADRYRRLYDIVTKLEKDWDQFTPKSRLDKFEKIKTIIAR